MLSPNSSCDVDVMRGEHERERKREKEKGKKKETEKKVCVGGLELDDGERRMPLSSPAGRVVYVCACDVVQWCVNGDVPLQLLPFLPWHFVRVFVSRRCVA